MFYLKFNFWYLLIISLISFCATCVKIENYTKSAVDSMKDKDIANSLLNLREFRDKWLTILTEKIIKLVRV